MSFWRSRAPLSWGQIFFLWVGALSPLAILLALGAISFDLAREHRREARAIGAQIAAAPSPPLPTLSEGDSLSIVEAFQRTLDSITRIHTDSNRADGLVRISHENRLAGAWVALGSASLLLLLPILAWLLWRSFHAAARPNDGPRRTP